MDRHGSMNRIYRLVWSQVSSAWVPVAETAKGRGKSARARSMLRRNVLAAAISFALAPLAHASPAASPCVAPACGVTVVAATTHPLGGQVVSGTGSITQSGNTTDIRQSSPDLALDWLSFNLGSQETVNFLQPSASAIVVNRIFSTNDSQILGHLDANGQVYLINPNGIIFGQGAQVNVGGLVASTLDVTDPSLSGGTRGFAGNGTELERQGRYRENQVYQPDLLVHMGCAGSHRRARHHGSVDPAETHKKGDGDVYYVGLFENVS
jgi:filamentous hemagglutinin family protein